MAKTSVSEIPMIDPSKKAFTHSGKAIVDVHEWDKDGKHLIKTGERNLQEEYNAAAVGTGVYGIIDRILKGSAVEPPAPSEGQYLDISGMSGMTTGEAYRATGRLTQFAIKEEPQEAPSEDVASKLEAALAEISELKKKLGE